MGSNIERREYRREARNISVVIKAQEGPECWPGVIRDLSMGGVGVFSKTYIPCEGLIHLEIESNSGQRVSCQGRIVWCREKAKEKDGMNFFAGVELISPVPKEYIQLLEWFSGCVL